MKIKVLYFARLREELGIAEETIKISHGTVATLLDLLRSRGAVWAQLLSSEQSYRVAINQVLVDSTAILSAEDEVAIFPPVTGG
ncbi:MAG: molybdopterin converting factor subunit 1 [Sulfuriferula sp.]